MDSFTEPITYAVKHKDETIRAASRSGGVFTALSDNVLDSGGVVYGSVLTDNFIAAHIRAEDKTERDKMRGSKYIESKLNTIFPLIKKDVLSGRLVLFTGTSCQVAGLKAFLEKSYENLLLVDILCHGVPSPKVWRQYLDWQESKHGKCTAVDFRNKKDYGWSSHIETMMFLQNGKTQQVDSDIFTTIFYKHLALRPSCYECKYKTIMHPGDITIADYWEIDRALPGFNDNKGVSLVMVNNDHGMDYFNRVKSHLICEKTRYSDSTRPSMYNPANRPNDRDKFWNDFSQRDFEYIANKYGKKSFSSRLKKNVKKFISASKVRGM